MKFAFDCLAIHLVIQFKNYIHFKIENITVQLSFCLTGLDYVKLATFLLGCLDPPVAKIIKFS